MRRSRSTQATQAALGTCWVGQHSGDLILVRLFMQPQGVLELGHRLDTKQRPLVPHDGVNGPFPWLKEEYHVHHWRGDK